MPLCMESKSSSSRISKTPFPEEPWVPLDGVDPISITVNGNKLPPTVGVGVGVELAPTILARTAETPFCVMVRTASTMNGCCV